MSRRCSVRPTTSEQLAASPGRSGGPDSAASSGRESDRCRQPAPQQFGGRSFGGRSAGMASLNALLVSVAREFGAHVARTFRKSLMSLNSVDYTIGARFGVPTVKGRLESGNEAAESGRRQGQRTSRSLSRADYSVTSSNSSSRSSFSMSSSTSKLSSTSSRRSS